ncbi:reverse transcriptase domain-containing protein [Tanacetum coccineum]
MREVHYHDWLSNPVMVKKHDDSWRMCVDFKDLNKACPKDGYPLLEIDWKVESLCGFPFKCFLDAYKGYHQIHMAEEDEEKTAFITNQGIFCYTKMPFDLRNAGATYQRLVYKALHRQIGKNLEVYVDDLVIKSRTGDEIVHDIEETFKTLRKINMKLNPKKCTFGVEEGMFLGYHVNTKGIKICPDKMKEHIAKLPMLTAPEEQEELIIYLAASKEVALRGPEVTTLHGKTGASTSTCKQKAKKILPSSSNHSRQVLADFIVERPEEEGQDDSTKEEEPLPAQWTLFTDGSSCVDGCGAGVILTDPEGAEFTYALRFQFEATNNEAEYEALIAGLRIAEKMGVQNLQVNVDSKLVANQVNGTYIAKETDMIKYLEKVKTLASTFRAFSIKQVPRSKNKKADALSKIASTSFAHLSKQVLVEELKEKSVNEIEVLAVVEEEGDSWMTPIHEYLTDETLPAERKKARAIKRKSQRFAIINGMLYKKSFLGPWLRCVGPSQANYVLFGLPGEIISDNRKQFRDNPFKDWCEKLCIQQHFASVKYPQIKGLVERANRSLGEGIKARLGKDNKNWMEEISHVLWAHRTKVKSSTRDTPFSLTYETEAVIPAEIGMPTFRTAEVDVAKNDEALEINLELLEEKREQAAIREVKSKRQMEKYYNTKVRNTSFKPGDWVYRSNEAM